MYYLYYTDTCIPCLTCRTQTIVLLVLHRYKFRDDGNSDRLMVNKEVKVQHNGDKVGFKMVCLKSFKTGFLRQINEGARIACCQADICMNSKAEFHQPSTVRVSTLLGNHNEEQTGRSASQALRACRNDF